MGNEKSFPAESSSHNFIVSFWVTLIVKQLSRNFNTFPKRNKQKHISPCITIGKYKKVSDNSKVLLLGRGLA